MFFFKQKTAYEMRISDWSSDVCSSDLERASAWLTEGRHFIQRADVVRNRVAFRLQIIGNRPAEVRVDDVMGRPGRRWPVAARQLVRALRPCFHMFQARSEEHTSELQSLMRISYAVFCLKKKTDTDTHIHTLSQTPATSSIHS